jgi:hypothetical protein
MVRNAIERPTAAHLSHVSSSDLSARQLVSSPSRRAFANTAGPAAMVFRTRPSASSQMFPRRQADQNTIHAKSPADFGNARLTAAAYGMGA